MSPSTPLYFLRDVYLLEGAHKLCNSYFVAALLRERKMNFTKHAIHPINNVGVTDIQGVVLNQWVSQVKSEVPAAAHLTDTTLIDSIPHFLENVFKALQTHSPEWTKINEFCKSHAAQRAALGTYDVKQILWEYNILRKLLFMTLDTAGLTPSMEDRDIILDMLHEAEIAAASKFTQAAMDKEIERLLSLAAESCHMGVFNWNLFTH